MDGEFLLIGSIYREPTVYIYIQKNLALVDLCVYIRRLHVKQGPDKVPQDRGSGAPQKTHSFLLDWEPFIIHLFLPHPAADFFFFL